MWLASGASASSPTGYPAWKSARGRADRGLSLVHSFVLAMAVVTGVTGVRALTAVGPFHGVVVMADGLLGVAIILLVFVRTLRTMDGLAG